EALSRRVVAVPKWLGPQPSTGRSRNAARPLRQMCSRDSMDSPPAMRSMVLTEAVAREKAAAATNPRATTASVRQPDQARLWTLAGRSTAIGTAGTLRDPDSPEASDEPKTTANTDHRRACTDRTVQ